MPAQIAPQTGDVPVRLNPTEVRFDDDAPEPPKLNASEVRMEGDEPPAPSTPPATQDAASAPPQEQSFIDKYYPPDSFYAPILGDERPDQGAAPVAADPRIDGAAQLAEHIRQNGVPAGQAKQIYRVSLFPENQGTGLTQLALAAMSPQERAEMQAENVAKFPDAVAAREAAALQKKTEEQQALEQSMLPKTPEARKAWAEHMRLYNATVKQHTDLQAAQARMGQMSDPENAVRARYEAGLSAADKAVVQPLDKLSAAGAEFGRAAGESALAGGGGDEAMQSPPPTDAQMQERLKLLPPGLVGTFRAVGGTVGGLAADPRMWPFFLQGGAEGILHEAMTGAFGAQMATGTYEQGGRIGEIMDRSDVPEAEKAEAVANFVISDLMAGHSIGGQAGHLSGAREKVIGALSDFSKIPQTERARIVELIRAKAPDVAQQIDQAAATPPTLKPTEVRMEGDIAPKAKLPKGAVVAEAEEGQKYKKNMKTVEVGGKNYVYDQRKTNPDEIAAAHASGNLWKLMGQEPPAEVQAQSEADAQGKLPEEEKQAEPPKLEPTEVKMEEPQTEQTDRYEQAKGVVKDYGTASTSLLQRKLKIGYGEAAHLIDRMGEDGLIGPPEGNRPRKWTGETVPPIDETRTPRTDVERRKLVEQMSEEEKNKELLTSDAVDLPNRRAFNEAEQRGGAASVGMSDADGLKALNDKFGYDAGNALLNAKAESLKAAGLDAYHDKGDEFIYRGGSPEEIRAKLEKARGILRDRVIEVETRDGKKLQFKGADFSYGTGKDLAEAESGLKGHKSEREARGERARGELRGITEVRSGEREEHQSPATNEELAARIAQAHNSGDTEAAKTAMRELVRQQLSKGEEKAAEPPKAERTEEKAPAAPPVEKKTAPAQTNKERFAETYARHLKAEIKKNPGVYATRAEKADEVARRMTDSFEQGGANNNSPAVRATLKELGIKDTFADIKKFLRNGEEAAAPPAEKKPVTPQIETPAYKYGPGAKRPFGVDQMREDADVKPPVADTPAKREEDIRKIGMDKLLKDADMKTGYGEKNTVFTEDKKNAALDRLRSKGSTLNSGIDPETVKDLIDVGGYHFEAGLREFADWSKQMLQDVGQWAHPYLETIHDEIKDVLGSTIKGRENGDETGHPEGRTGRSEVQESGGQGTNPSGNTQAEGIRGTETGRDSQAVPGVNGAADVERPEPVSGKRSASEPGGRAGAGSDTAAERGAGNGRPERQRGADGKLVDAPAPVDRGPAIDEQHAREQSRNFRYKDPAEVGRGGEMAKIDQNIAAIKLLKQLDKEGRHATPEEQETLARYTGWGGLSGIFNRTHERQYKDRYAELTGHITGDELRGIQRSTINAHYTSPEVVSFMWDMARKMGFEGGRIIEPGMGVGYFYGLMPEEMMQHPDTRLLGVELDPITGRIAQELYQGAKILNTGYEKVQIPDNSLDFAIGNVPFADVKPFDPRYKDLRPRPVLHDYYFLKTLDKVRPGGLVSFITSRYTMDKVDSRTRDMIADRADLVAAYRLPNTAFKGVAGTEVTADLLILRKRGGAETRGGEPFRDVVPHKEGIKINQYFQQHPENMFGEMTLGGTMYRSGEAALTEKGDLGDHLRRALENAPEDVYGHQAAQPDQPAFADPTERAPDKVKAGQFYKTEDGSIKIKRNGVPENLPADMKAWTRGQIKDAVELRDKAAALLSQMMADKHDAPLKPLQAELNRAYDKFVKKYGPTHSVSVDLRKNFGSDPDFGLLLALENYDKGKPTAKADIFTRRTMRPWETLGALPDHPESWMPASLSEKGKLDPEYIGQLAGKSRDEVIRTLEEKNLAFRDPESGEHVPSDDYLSGSVRDKLATARRAAEADPAFARNVEALEKVQPEKIRIHDIQPKVGMSWIPGHVYEDFIHDMAETPDHKREPQTRWVRGNQKVEKPLEVALTPENNWNVEFGDGFNHVTLSNKFGTKALSGAKVLDDTINLRQSNVYMHDEEGRPRIDKVATLSAREAQQRLKEAFAKWFQEKNKHHALLEEKYNDTFNGTRLREFDGSHLKFPGMNPEWTPHSHQANAIWRVVSDGRALLSHAVGAGKTLEMIGAGMEMRRLGTSRKNMYAVPNNMVGQWTADFARIYPGSRVLSAPESGFAGPNERNEFMARAATGDWDAVIVPHSVFDRVPVSDEYQTKTINRELAAARESLEEFHKTSEGMSQQAKRQSIKQMEKNIQKYEARLEKLASGKKDNALRFDQLGVDTLFVDEVHRYKNLQVHTSLSNVAGVPTSASQRALDYLMKTEYMLDSHNGRGVVGATATPVTNTVAEVYNMTRLHAPDVLERAGIRNFDQWRANFADEVTSWEYAADGVNFRPVTSLSQFINVPELATMFRSFADVKTKRDLNLPVPEADRQDVTVRVTDDQNPLLQEIADRAEFMRAHPRDVDPKVDNWLKLSSDARKISLDPRLYVDGLQDHPDSKINAVVANAKKIYDATTAEKGTQLIFSDFFAAHDKVTGVEKFNALREIKKKLIAEGVPESQIAIVTDYSKGQMRGLQEDLRSGKIRFAMGSTEKLGVGLNVQERLAALHHTDQPWRPADVEQREGRILRQGNMYPKVTIARYISEPQSITSPKAFDLQMFQKLERKAKFIDEFMSGGVKDRRMEEVAGRAMLSSADFALAKAQATGNPDALTKIQMEHETNRLYALQRDWQARTNEGVWRKKMAEENAAEDEARLASVQKTRETHETWEKSPEDQRATAVIDGKEFKPEKDNSVTKQISDYIDAKYGENALGTVLAGRNHVIEGVEIPVRVGMSTTKGASPAEYQLSGEWHGFNSAKSLLPSAAGLLRNVDKRIGQLKDHIEESRQKVESYEKQGESPYAAKLAEAEQRLKEVNKRLGIGVEKIEEQVGDEAPGAEKAQKESDDDGGQVMYSGLDPIAAYRAIRKTVTDAANLGKLYHSGVDALLEKMGLGKPQTEIRKFDPDAADLATKIAAGGQYHQAVAKAIAEKVTGLLTEKFNKGDSADVVWQKNEVSRDRMKGFHFMADEQNREWLKENHPDEYDKWNSDPKIAAAVAEYAPFMDELRGAVQQLGGKVIDEDYIKRVMDFTTAGVFYEPRPLPPGVEGPKYMVEGKSFARGGGRDNTVSPQVDRSKARKDEGAFYYQHGVFDFGPSFEKRWIEVQSKLDEHRLAVHAMSRGTRIDGKEGMPDKIFYNGHEFYRPDIAKEIREVQNRGVSSESKALADELGVSELPAPKKVQTYSVYEPMKGSRFENAARGLAGNVLAADGSDLKGQAATVERMAKLRYAVPEEIAKALHDAQGQQAEGRLAKKVREILGPITQAIRQQIVGLAYGVPHMANVLRKVMQATPGSVLNPKAWANAFHVAFSKELKRRGISGVNDYGYDALLRNAGISEGAIPEYKHYIEGNFDLKSWEGLRDTAKTAGNAFRQGGKEGGRVTPASALAGVGRLPLEALNRFSEAGHDNLFKAGGIDQRARLWLHDYLKDQRPGMSEADIAHAVNGSFGRYNRASWTELQKALAPLMLFPGWDYSSITYALKHPFKTTVAPAVLMLLANGAIGLAGGNDRKDRHDLRSIHIGKYAIRANLFNDNMGSHIWGWALRGGQATLDRKSGKDITGAMASGIPGDVAGASVNTLNPLLSGVGEVSFNRRFGGSTREIVPRGDGRKRGTVPGTSKALDDYAKFAGGKFFPLYGQISESATPSLASLARLGGVSVYKKR